jgi:phosphoribosyl 1,2-cyclic phosphodiesterase
VALSHDGEPTPRLVLDAGTGIRRLGTLTGGAPYTGALLLTHLHWDHVHGMPFCAAADRQDARVAVFLPAAGDGASAEEVLGRGMSPPHFPIGPEGLRGSWSFSNLEPGTLELEGFTVQVLEIPHKGGRTFGYRVNDGRSVVAYMPDHCPTALGRGPDGWGDYHEAAVALASGADLLVHDAQLVAEELAAEAAFGHAAAEYAVGLGKRAGCRRVALFHHKPDRTDDQVDKILGRFGGSEAVIMASESMALVL